MTGAGVASVAKLGKEIRQRARRMTSLRLAAALCLVALLLGVVPSLGLPTGGFPGAGLSGTGVARADDLENAQEELDRIQKLIEQKQAELDRVLSQEKSVTRDLNRIDRELESLRSDLRDLEGQLTVTEGNIAQAGLNIVDASARLDARNGLMMKRIRAMSEVGYVNYLEVILGSRSFSDFLGRFELLRQVLSSDVILFREVREEKRQLEVKKAYLEEQQAELTRLKNDTDARKAAVEEKQQTKKELLAELRDSKEAIKDALDELERTSQQLQDYILQIQIAAGRAGDKPAFKWPVSGPITSRFGMRFHPILKTNRMHTGIDIAVARGTSIKASAAGYVILAGWAGGYGKCVIIDHGGYWSSLYAHMDSIGVSLNGWVSQGAVIGTVGSTGYSTGPHLHFEVRYRGSPQDPLRGDLLPPK